MGPFVHQFGACYHRRPLADCIRRKLPRYFYILIADEVHQCKAKGSDQGWAFDLARPKVKAADCSTATKSPALSPTIPATPPSFRQPRPPLPAITTFDDCLANRGLTRAALKPARHPEPVEGSPPLPTIPSRAPPLNPWSLKFGVWPS